MKSEQEIREAMQEGGIIDSIMELVNEPYRKQVKQFLINQLNWVLDE